MVSDQRQTLVLVRSLVIALILLVLAMAGIFSAA